MKRSDAMRVVVAPIGFAWVVGVLVVAGQGRLAAPPVTSFEDVSTWLDHTDTVTAAVAIVRVLALGVAAWLLVASVIAAAARLAGRARLAAAADRALPSAMRRLLGGVASAGMALAGAGTVASAGEALASERVTSTPAQGEGTATMSVLPDEDPPSAPAVPASAPAPAPTTATTWTVESGDSFWSIAEEVLGDASGRTPTDAEVGPYWRALIAANRDRITSGNPDLIYPGQVFTLPPI